jgi:hypothetical protein
MNRYGYTHGNPVNNIDPSGMLVGVLEAVLRTVIDVLIKQAPLLLSYKLVKGARDTILYTIAAQVLVKAAEAQLDADARDTANGEDISRRYGIPVLGFGFGNLYEHAYHVLDAQGGRGYTASRRQASSRRDPQQRIPDDSAPPHPQISPILHYQEKRPDDGWLETLIPSGGEEIESYLSSSRVTLPMYTRILPRSYARDEYPFGRSQEGGNSNFRKNMVSVRLVHEAESRAQGSLYASFRTAASLKEGSTFVVISKPGTSGYWINGQWNEFNYRYPTYF